MTGWSLHTHSILQAWLFLTCAAVVFAFFLAIVAQQFRSGVRPTWPLPGGYVGAAFFFWIGLLTFHMSMGRFGHLPWRFISWQASIVYGVITLAMVATLVRWWRHGFDDDESWDGIQERRSGLERRSHWWQGRNNEGETA
jgi:hypothetical protein